VRPAGSPGSAHPPTGAAGPETEVPDGPVVGLTGARFGGARRRKRVPGQDAAPRPAPSESAPPAAVPAVHDGPAADGAPDELEPVGGGSAFVRPYVFTRGRTRSTFELSLETLVTAVPQTAPAGLTSVHQVVLGLCRESRSVAELAALAGVPFGVARVLVGDLAAAGAVAVHRSVDDSGPDLALMQRVLSGLRRL
jgi:Protein of unknown function (DUF742)